MAVEVIQFSDNEIYVNDKLVRLNMDGSWEAKIELTQFEGKALFKHLKAQKK